jgi:prepilin-type N-terminal cleavage/methylation domain-containing protein
MKKFNLTSDSDSEAGFTLLEILIAITLLAFMTMGVISITQNASDTMDRTTVTNKNNLQIETALARFEWDFSQIYSPLFFSTPLNLSQADPYGNMNNNDANMDGRDDNSGAVINNNNNQPAQVSPELQEYYQRLMQRFDQNEHFSSISKEGLPIPRYYSPEKNIFEFFTSSNRRKLENTKQSHFAWVRYALGDALKKDPDEERNANIPPSLKTLVRYYSADDPYDDKRINPEDDRVKAAVLLENVESLEFQFWDMDRRKWENNLRTIPNGESLLRGVKIMLTWYDSNGIKRTAERVYRNHWPLEIPQDQAASTNTANANNNNNNRNNNNNNTNNENNED